MGQGGFEAEFELRGGVEWLKLERRENKNYLK